jgi:hypothetical protein
MQNRSISDHQLRPPRFLLDDQIVNKARRGERDPLGDRVHPLSPPSGRLIDKVELLNFRLFNFFRPNFWGLRECFLLLLSVW